MATRAWNEIYETDPSKIGDVTTLMGGLRGLAGAASGGLANRFIGMSSTPTKAAESATGEATPSNISEAFTPRAGAVSVPLSPIVPAAQMVSGTTPSMKAVASHTPGQPIPQATAPLPTTGYSPDRAALQQNFIASQSASPTYNPMTEVTLKNGVISNAAGRTGLGGFGMTEANRLAEVARQDQASRDFAEQTARQRGLDILSEKESMLRGIQSAAQSGNVQLASDLTKALQASGGAQAPDNAALIRAQTERETAPKLGMKYLAEAEADYAKSNLADVHAQMYPELLKTKVGVLERKEVSTEAKAIRDALRRLDLKIAETEAGAIPNPQLAAAYKKQRENQMILLKKLQGAA